ncbi:MAG: MerR family transcriptional regulator [Pirellula sp.]|jgi:excisionase family DNA binding protein
MNQFVSVKDASHYLGVSSSTFKRICEQHSIPLIRTLGGHRRIDRADLDHAYSLLWGRSQKKHSSTELSPVDSAKEMVEQLLDGNAQRAMSTLWARIDRLDELSHTLESTLIAALWKIGELWRTQEIDIYQEHICSNTACTVLDMIMQRLPEIDGHAPLAIGGTFERIFDTIGTKILSVVLRSIGIRTIDLGCNLPAASIAKAAQELNASIVWICHTHVENVDSLLANHQLLRKLLPSPVQVMIGGGGLSPAMRRSLSDCLYFESISVMSEAMKQSLHSHSATPVTSTQ